MFDTLMVEEELGVMSSPDLLTELGRLEREISSRRARQLRVIRELGRRSRTRPDVAMIASRLDVSSQTATVLLDTANWTAERSPQMANLESGDWSLDRTAAMGRLYRAGADEDTMKEAGDHDIGGIDQLGALTRRVRRRDERQAHQERYLRAHPSLDSSVGFISAQLGGYDWRAVTKALDDRADQFPRDAQQSTREQLRADALVALAHDWLDGTSATPANGRGSGPIITLMVDPHTAGATNGEAGVTITDGPQVGPDTLDLLMCEGSVEILIDRGEGRPLAVGPTTRVVPPKVRRYVLNRDRGCTIDGCANQYRLEVHHILPRGGHDLLNLTTLCWWHHHKAVHGYGQQIDPTSPPHRRRIIPHSHDPP